MKRKLSENVQDAEHMSISEFRESGHKLIDWLCNYYERIEDFPVQSKAKPGEIFSSLATKPPFSGQNFEALLLDFQEKIFPGLTHWQAPNFLAYFPANASFPSILAEILTAGLGVQGMLWVTSPACTELEEKVVDWLIAMLGLPQSFSLAGLGGGVIQDSASSAVLCSILAARELKMAGQCRVRGSDHRLVGYCSVDSHSCIEKAFSVTGIGTSRLRKIKVDEHGRLDTDELIKQLQLDLKNNLIPFYVCGTIGTTSVLAIDPISKIGEIAETYEMWLHVDAAMAGTATICPEFRYLIQGIDKASSYCFNPHKWMLTNFDCNCFFVSNRNSLLSALSVMPEYLKNEKTLNKEVIDFRDWQIPLGRRFRALKLWSVISSYGEVGIRKYVRFHVGLTRNLVAEIEKDERFELFAYSGLNLICFRARGSDSLNYRLLNNLNESGEIFLSHATFNGKYVLRICVGQVRLTARSLENCWNKICEETDILLSSKE